MLTITAIHSATAVGDYYQQEALAGAGGYYDKDVTLGESSGFLGIVGSGKEMYGLGDTQFDARLLDSLTDYKSGMSFGAGKKSIVGNDFCFSAPKSVSVNIHYTRCAQTRQDLISAVRGAVKDTMEKFEKERFKVRVFSRDETTGVRTSEYQKATGMVAGLFGHGTNRNGEPQVHVHTFVANHAVDKNGKVRAMNQDYLSKSKAASFQKTFGKFFQQNLRSRIESLGYETRNSRVNGGHFWEMRNVPQSIINHFSSSRADVENFINSDKCQSQRQKNSAGRMTRSKKNYGVDPKKNRERIRAEADKLGMSEPVAESRNEIKNIKSTYQKPEAEPRSLMGSIAAERAEIRRQEMRRKIEAEFSQIERGGNEKREERQGKQPGSEKSFWVERDNERGSRGSVVDESQGGGGQKGQKEQVKREELDI